MTLRYAFGRGLAASLLLSTLLAAPAEAQRWEEFKRRAGGAWGAVRDEVSLWPSMAYHFPSAYWETAKDGSQRDSLFRTGRAIGTKVKEEAEFAPQWLPSLPGAYIETAADGRQLSSLRGGVTGFTDRGSFGLARIDTQPYANTPEHRQAWDNGHTVGERTFDEMALTVGTAGLARGGSMALRQGQRGMNYARNGWNSYRGVRPPPGPSNSRFLHQQYLDDLARRQSLSRRPATREPLPTELQNMSTRNTRPGDIRFSQSTVEPNVLDIEGSMRTGGWQGDAIDVVRMPDGRLTALDNRRLLAAQNAGLDRVPVRVHSSRANMPQSWQSGGAFQREAGANTFGEAVRLRSGRQGVGFPGRGNFTQPSLAQGVPDAAGLYNGVRMPIRPTTPWTNAGAGAVMLDSMGRAAPNAGSAPFGFGGPQGPAAQPQGPGVFGIPQGPAGQPQGPAAPVSAPMGPPAESWLQSSAGPEQPAQDPMGF